MNVWGGYRLPVVSGDPLGLLGGIAGATWPVAPTMAVGGPRPGGMRAAAP